MEINLSDPENNSNNSKFSFFSLMKTSKANFY